MSPWPQWLGRSRLRLKASRQAVSGILCRDISGPPSCTALQSRSNFNNRDAGPTCEQPANIRRCPQVPASDGRLQHRQGEWWLCRDSAKPSGDERDQASVDGQKPAGVEVDGAQASRACSAIATEPPSDPAPHGLALTIVSRMNVGHRRCKCCNGFGSGPGRSRTSARRFEVERGGLCPLRLI